MINAGKLTTILIDYRRDFINNRWKEEMYKWEAVKHFQDNWDINASDFVNMFSKSIEKTGNLLLSHNNFPGGMIVQFAKKDTESVRSMFIDLYNENWIVHTWSDRNYKGYCLLYSTGDMYPSVPCKRILLNQ